MDLIQDNNILLNTIVGWEVEFYSNFDLNKTKDELEKVLSKKILLFDKCHSDFMPTYDIFKIEPDYSGGKNTLELVTGPMPYTESKLILTKIFNWIKRNGSTSERCGLHINVSFNKEILNTGISSMNPLKFILDFDENVIYNDFPYRRNNIYAKSIKKIIPHTLKVIEDLDDPALSEIDASNFILPKTKYYGVNFKKLTKNYIEFRYLGGKNYQNKYNEIIKVADYCILTLYKSVINKNEYTKKNKKELFNIINSYNDILKSYKSYGNFKVFYPKIELTIDLNLNSTVINTFYSNISRRLFNLLSDNNFKIGKINFDSDKNKLQLKDVSYDGTCDLNNVDIIDCKLTGVIDDSNIYTCELNNVDLKDCNIYENTIIKDSRLKDCNVSKTTKLINCYVDGNGTFHGKMESGVFRNGKISKLAVIKPAVSIIEYKKID